MRRTVILVAATMIVAGLTTVSAPASAQTCTRSIRLDPPQTVTEGVPLVFTATLVTEPGCPTVGTASYRTQVPVIGGGFDATPGTKPTTPKADYITTGGMLEWKPGDPVTKEIQVQTLADSRAEVSEEVLLCLDKESDVEIPFPCIRGLVSSPMCVPPDTTLPFAIGLSLPARDTVTVVYDTIEGTAKEGRDYIGVHKGQARIAPGQLDTIAPVRILPNDPGEEFEYFFVEFQSTHDGYTETSRVKVDIMTPR